MPTNTKMATPDLPQEILIEIFSRLPTKSVGKFKCLSKSWRGLLSTTQFIKLHLTRIAHEESLILISPSNSLHSITLPIKYDSISRSIELTNTWTKVVGSCNGLALLANDDDEVFVVNPITLQQVKIPDSPLTLEEEESLTTYGFGYDCSSDDYKIVALSYFDTYDTDCVDTFVEVYSLKRGVWKRVNNYGLDVPELPCGAFVNGAIHWVASTRESGNPLVIAAFDLANETFYEIPSPIADDDSVLCELVVLGGCLCMVITEGSNVTCFWVMKNCGLVESWTKFSVDVDPQWNIDKPLCFIGDDEVLLLTLNESLIVYNLKEKMVSAGIPGRFADGGTFVESLVSPAFSVSN
ncbi:hypothetical protein ACJIZ3_025267 [Penstemon smallii]|uniref:F-box domain-containing protein n=1 Tax=Penstemon smallii TaxID=265156 RepID=A0ABD3TVT3_9LAMI